MDQYGPDILAASKATYLLSYLMDSITELHPIIYLCQKLKNIFKVDISGLFHTQPRELEFSISQLGPLVVKASD